MTDRPFGTTTTTSTESPDSTTDVAKDQAKSVASDAKQSGQQVAETAKEQTREVASEASQQAKELYQQVRAEVGDQAATQHRRAASGLRTLGDELSSMAQGSEQSGVATDLAKQASDRVHTLAGWLEQREPGDVLSEVTSFARRKPGTFLAAAAAVGFLGGRLTRGLAADSGDGDSATSPTRTSGADFSAGATGYNPGPATDAPAATTRPNPLVAEPAWPTPNGGALPPTGAASTTGMAPGISEERA